MGRLPTLVQGILIAAGGAVLAVGGCDQFVVGLELGGRASLAGVRTMLGATAFIGGMCLLLFGVGRAARTWWKSIVVDWKATKEED